MKKRLIVLLFLFSLCSFAQETDGFSIPSYAAKTPEAAAFLKYGEYPVNLSTGVPNISIPLYTVQIPGYTLPITLDYHASGIKVEQEATWVGLGWNLNYGAQIILNVQEEVDQNLTMPYEMPDINALTQYYSNHPHQFIGGEIAYQQLDKSRIRDVYQFSSPTASGSFYIRDNSPMDIVVFPPQAFKVEMNPEQGVRFKITDPSGNIYRFHHWPEYNAIERSYRTETFHDWYDSAWYVTNIETANKQTIDFVYEADGDLAEYNMTHKREIFWKHDNCGCMENLNADPSLDVESNGISPFIQEGGTTTTESKKIRQIIFNQGQSRVLFERTLGRADLANGSNTSFLNLISIQHKNPLTGLFEHVRGYDFEYSYFNTDEDYFHKRLKLDKVMETITEEAHTFTYSDIPLPSKRSFGQDLFGYYNGEDNNSELIPEYHITDPVNTVIGSANRKVNPDFNQAGILKEIHYPTKGWTTFNYETNQFYGTYNNESFEQPTNLYGSIQGVGPGGLNPIGQEETDPSPGDQYTSQCQDPDICVRYYTIPFNVGPGTIASINTVLTNSTPSGQTPYHHMYGRVRIFNGSTTPVYDSGSPRYLTWSETVDNISLNGSGKVVIEAWGEYIHMAAGLTYYDPGPKNINAGGLRVASIENYDADNRLLTKKVFDYSDPANPDKTSGKLINDRGPNYNFNFTTPFFLQNTDLTTCPPDYSSPIPPEEQLPIPQIDIKESYFVTSRTRFHISGNNVAYEYVKESMVDNSGNTNGYTLYKFNAENDWYKDFEIFIARSWRRGELLVKEDYKTDGNGFDLVRKEVNTYADDNAKIAYIEGFKMLRTASASFDATGSNTIESLQNRGCNVVTDILNIVSFKEFNHPVKWHYLSNKQVTEYFDDGASFVTNVDYIYNNPTHMQLSKQVTTTSDSKTLETRYFYPGDAAVQTEPYVSTLLQRNILTAPLKTQTYLNGEKIGEQKTLYNAWPTYDPTVSMYLPEIMQGAKGNDALENRIIFVERDKAGNAVEVKLENGVSVCYIWAYNDSQVVAKIENATYSSISPTLIQDIKNVSVTGTEQQLIDELNQLRLNLPNSMVTTYTYEPLIGIHTVTDPRGVKTTYELDNQSRLRFVKDQFGNILSENQYHYKN